MRLPINNEYGVLSYCCLSALHSRNEYSVPVLLYCLSASVELSVNAAFVAMHEAPRHDRGWRLITASRLVTFLDTNAPNVALVSQTYCYPPESLVNYNRYQSALRSFLSSNRTYLLLFRLEPAAKGVSVGRHDAESTADNVPERDGDQVFEKHLSNGNFGSAHDTERNEKHVGNRVTQADRDKGTNGEPNRGWKESQVIRREAC